MSSICLDSSAWIEITHDGPNAATFAEALASTAPGIVPTICLYEIAGYTTRVAGQAATEELLTFIQQHTIAPISATLAATRRHFRSCSQTRHGGHHSLAILNRVLAGECLKGWL